MSGRRVAVLLRAINVGGRRLAMADFKAALASLGYPGAETLGAAGTALITAAAAADRALEGDLEAHLTRAVGAPVEAFARDAAQLAAVLEANPFAAMAAADPSHLVVLFTKDDPRAGALEALRAKIVGPEQAAGGPGCVYVSYPAGIGESKLTASVIERALKVRVTGRNWNTVQALAARAAG